MSTDSIGVATMAEMMGTSAKLAADPILKAQVEDEIRKTLPPDAIYRIDEFGIGHLGTALHVSSVDAGGKQ